MGNLLTVASRSRVGIWTLVFTLLTSCPQALLSQSKTSSQTHHLLDHFELSGRNLAKAFIFGNQHPDELVIALQDPNPHVQLNAQRLIRYLGDPEGMQALFASYESGGTNTFVGPVPAPLSEWDFTHLKKEVLCDRCQLRGSDVDYIYALAIDGSPKAQEMLSRIKSKTNFPWLYGNQMTLEGSDDKEVLKNLVDRAFYLEDEDKKASTVRLLARTLDGRKALYEIHVNHGPLAEKWFHIVLKRDGASWKYLSVSLAAQS